MPSLRHNSAMLSSPHRPAITMRIFSSAEYCRRVARRISRTRFSASPESVSAFDLVARSFAVKMSSKSSLPQSLHSVHLELTANSLFRWNVTKHLVDGVIAYFRWPETHDYAIANLIIKSNRPVPDTPSCRLTLALAPF
jgi:hypothetical protein